jgi:ABC-type sugar transport system ATPase subunit
MANLSMVAIAKSFGTVQVLKDINLEIRAGEFIVFVGPSGCGKSTLLRMIAGLESISEGEMRVDGQRFNEVPAARRGVAMVFQNYALYPHMTVFGNMAYSLKIAGMSKSEIKAKVHAATEMLQLTEYLDRRPGLLSGGQRQRVAIGRALVRDPRIFLFDEPLSNLDASLRAATRIEISRLKRSLPQTTMIYVTHDQIEAMTMADRIVAMRAGQIEQIGTPMELYHSPANRFVAGFIGSPAMNFLPASAAVQGFSAVPAATELGIRPEDLHLADENSALTISGSVQHFERLGEVTIAHLALSGGQMIIAKLAGDVAISRDQSLRLGLEATRLHQFDDTGRALAKTA